MAELVTAFQSTVLQSKRMKDLLGNALGGCVGTPDIAIDANPEDIQMTACVAFLADGTYDATLEAVDPIVIATVCPEAGQVVPSGVDAALFVLHDGTNVVVRLGSESKVTSRASVNAALVETIDYLTLPSDVDASTYICIGYVKFTTVEAFTVGTTSIADQTETFYNVRNLLPGTKVAAV